MYLEKLPLTELRGSLRACGEAYGEELRRFIHGFLIQETPANPRNLALAKKCAAMIRRHTPRASSFIAGMARGASLSYTEMILPTLLEEIYHLRFAAQPHCSAVTVPGRLTAHGGALTAQTWDLPPSYLPWAGLLRMAARGGPRTLTMHYPGVPACCGLNSRGLSLMWTGGGYFPVLLPRPGVPAYALIFELLQKKSVDEALRFLSRTPRAGCFLFLLGDAAGRHAVVEATAGRIAVDRQDRPLYRANLYMLPPIMRAARQSPPDPKKIHSVGRMRAMKRMCAAFGSRVGIADLRSFLGHPEVFVDVHLKSLSLDSFIADSRAGALRYRRASGERWHTVRV